MSTTQHNQTQSEIISITTSDLPLCCPRPDAPLWSLHPRVYIEIEKDGLALCPYCSATYQLVSENSPE